MNRTVAIQPLDAAGRSELGEGPVWDHRRGRLYWVDITKGHLHWIDHHADRRETIRLSETIGFVCLTDRPEVVAVGCGARLALLNVDSSQLDALAEFEAPDAGLRCNDGKCDPTGRLWAGTMATGPNGFPPGSLYSVEPGGRARRRLSGIGCSNGLAWNTHRREFYFIDSLTRRIDRHSWDAASGDLGPGQPLATFTAGEGMPDGMCIDAEGHLWVAFWDGGCVRQIDGHTGAVCDQIDLPVTRPTSCTWGGDDLATLFITTAAEGLSAARRAAQPMAGSIFTIRPNARGLPASIFRLSPPALS